MSNKVLEVKDLNVSFWTNNGMVRAVRGISFDLYKGETLAIVGESGSGKSVSTRAILGILSNNAVIDSGEIQYENINLAKVHEEDFHRIRGHKIGMIFQDPLSSLNPIMKVGKQITEGILLNGDRVHKFYEALINDDLIDYRRSVNLIQDAKEAAKMAKMAIKKQVKIAKVQEKNRVGGLITNTEFEYNKQITELKSEIKTLKSEQKDISSLEANVATLTKELATKVASIKEEYKNYTKTTLASLKEELVNNYEAKKQAAKEINASETDVLKAKKAKLSVTKKDAKAQTKAHFDLELGKAKAELEKAQARLKDSTAGDSQAIKEEILKLKENIKRVRKVTKAEAEETALRVMEEVGIPEPAKRFKQYPFQFSGGMRQRIVIAIALTQNPEILICDEPTTALDVTIQSQILELINDIKQKRNMSVIFITHDLGVVANMADRVAVMYAGKIIEKGTVEDIFYEPKHPYTWALLSAMPDLETKDKLGFIPGTPPNMLFPPKGDAFAARNKYAMKIDFEEQPPMFRVSDTHYAATWLLHPDAPKVEMPEVIKDRIQRMQALTKGSN